MNALVNRVQLIGSIGQNPETKKFEKGQLVKFSLATNEIYYNNKGEKITDTTWHNVVIWGKTSEIIEKYAKKGDRIMIEGKLSNRSYEGKDGQKRYISEVVAQEVMLLSNKNH
jgi:single-strand DNA-binding protein